MPDLTELPDLPDLARDVRQRAVTPPYQEVRRRVRAQRRRTVGGTLAAAVLVVAGVAVWQSTGTTAAPQPTRPSPSPTDESWQSVVEGEMAHPFDVAGSDDGSVAILWRSLVHPEPSWALVVRDADGTTTGVRLDDAVALTTVPGGWVAANGAEGWLVSPDGSWQPLPEPDRARTVRPGDVLVDTEAGSRFYATTDHRWADVAASQPAAAAGYVTPDGHLVSCATDAEGQPFAFRSGEHPARRLDVGETRGALTCALAGSANYVTAEILGDVADGGIPLRAVLTSRDGGATWERASDLPYGISANSMAVTSGGATVLAFDDGRLHVVRPGRPTDVAPDTYGTVFGGGSRVYALSYALSKGPLLYSDDDGATWQETVLPGMESSKD